MDSHSYDSRLTSTSTNVPWDLDDEHQGKATCSSGPGSRGNNSSDAPGPRMLDFGGVHALICMMDIGHHLRITWSWLMKWPVIIKVSIRHPKSPKSPKSPHPSTCVHTSDTTWHLARWECGTRRHPPTGMEWMACSPGKPFRISTSEVQA